MNPTPFEPLPDEAIVTLIQAGNSNALDYLLSKYKNIVKIKARAYFLIGADQDDIIQEGMIGLYKAIVEFDGVKSPFFKPFAELCVSRQMFSAIKTSQRLKHSPLNKYVPLDGQLDELTDPEHIFIDKESKNYIEAEISKALSPLEKHTLALFLAGESYADIASILSKDEKSIDNALQRVRKKTAKIVFLRNSE